MRNHKACLGRQSTDSFAARLRSLARSVSRPRSSDHLPAPAMLADPASGLCESLRVFCQGFFKITQSLHSTIPARQQRYAHSLRREVLYPIKMCLVWLWLALSATHVRQPLRYGWSGHSHGTRASGPQDHRHDGALLPFGTEAHPGGCREIGFPTDQPTDTTTDTKGLERASAEAPTLQQVIQ
jgi:hypothetical protein